MRRTWGLGVEDGENAALARRSDAVASIVDSQASQIGLAQKCPDTAVTVQDLQTCRNLLTAHGENVIPCL